MVIPKYIFPIVYHISGILGISEDYKAGGYNMYVNTIFIHVMARRGNTRN